MRRMCRLQLSALSLVAAWGSTASALPLTYHFVGEVSYLTPGAMRELFTVGDAARYSITINPDVVLRSGVDVAMYSALAVSARIGDQSFVGEAADLNALSIINDMVNGSQLWDRMSSTLQPRSTEGVSGLRLGQLRLLIEDRDGTTFNSTAAPRQVAVQDFETPSLSLLWCARLGPHSIPFNCNGPEVNMLVRLSSIDVVEVSEPSSLGLIGLAGLGAMLKKGRRSGGVPRRRGKRGHPINTSCS